MEKGQEKMKRLFLIFGLLLFANNAFGASARTLPLSYNEKTFGGAGFGRNYTDVATWEADTDNNLVTAAKGEMLTCFADAAPYLLPNICTISGSINNANYFRVIRAANGEHGTGTSGVRFYYNDLSANTAMFVLSESVHVYDIAVYFTGTTTNAPRYCFQCRNSDMKPVLVGCVASSLATTGGIVGFYSSNTGSPILINCVFSSNNSSSYAGFLAGDTSTGMTCYNCTCVGAASYGWFSGTAPNTGVSRALKNCIAQGQTNHILAAPFFVQTSCLTTGVTFAADGYNLASTDQAAKDTGTDLSADSVFPFTDDIDGDIRPLGSAWDIGCDEINAIMQQIMMY